MRPRTGTSFLELIVVLALLGVLLGLTAPATLRWRDGLAVRAARDDLAAAFALARASAAASGGAVLVLDSGAAVFWVAAGGSEGRATDLAALYGVRIDGSGARIEFAYDALGIGRLASRTLRLRRGDAEAGLTVSAYGRVRRW
ncbi:MAG TPA: hypothetical protein VMM12_13390 [Longimicrobiales bacterium]|nr:hypothetical protein [Longimicrobiales bacterium]